LGEKGRGEKTYSPKVRTLRLGLMLAFQSFTVLSIDLFLVGKRIILSYYIKGGKHIRRDKFLGVQKVDIGYRLLVFRQNIQRRGNIPQVIVMYIVICI